jgi:phosphatidate cytidylyltransferase
VASLLKREYGAKDYGNILPGHGGIVDRFDSILAISTVLLMLCMVWSPFTLV